MKRLTLVDWKSSKGFYEEMAIQTVAYGRAYNIRASKLGKPLVEALGVLRLDKETGLPEYHKADEKEEQHWRGFCGILEYYKAVIEPTITGRSRDRFYVNPDDKNEKGPSVTTVLSCIDKPALVQWAANCSSDYVSDNIEELRDPNTSRERVEQILKKARTAHRDVSKKATDIGSIVHDAIETYLKGGNPEPLIENYPQAQRAFLAFLDWREEYRLEPIALECTIFHPVLRYGGTFDFLGYLDVENKTNTEEKK